jgi:hypothetical protein
MRALSLLSPTLQGVEPFPGDEVGSFVALVA